MASNQDRAAALVRGIEASITGDSSVIVDLYTDDVEGFSPALHVTSAAELAVEFEDRDEAFSEVELVVNPLDVGDDRACVEWSATATHSGPLELDDDVIVEPTGLRITLTGVTIAEFDGDRIRRFRQYWDEVELLAQLDLLPGRLIASVIAKETTMSFGPVEYLIVAFPGNQFNGEIAPTLADLIASDTIRVLDLVFIAKDGDGIVVSVEFDEHDDLSPFAALEAELHNLISAEDIEYAAHDLEPNSSAALLIWEDRWAVPLVDAMRNSGGVLVESARIPHDLIEDALAALEAVD